MTTRPITALQNDPPIYNSFWLLDSIYKMTPLPIIALQNDPPAYNSLWLLDSIYKMTPQPILVNVISDFDNLNHVWDIDTSGLNIFQIQLDRAKDNLANNPMMSKFKYEWYGEKLNT